MLLLLDEWCNVLDGRSLLFWSIPLKCLAFRKQDFEVEWSLAIWRGFAPSTVCVAVAAAAALCHTRGPCDACAFVVQRKVCVNWCKDAAAQGRMQSFSALSVIMWQTSIIIPILVGQIEKRNTWIVSKYALFWWLSIGNVREKGLKFFWYRMFLKYCIFFLKMWFFFTLPDLPVIALP